MPLAGLEGKVAVVTGAAGGLGAATAERLISEGASVALVDVKGDALNETAARLGDRAFAVRASAADREGVEEYTRATVDRFGRIDLAYFNAGYTPPLKSVVDDELDDLDLILSLDIAGVYMGLRAAARQMIAQGDGGSIVAASSALGLRGGANFALYSASKHGVIGMVKSTALELASFGIRVNAVCPGYVDTAMMAPAELHSNPSDRSAGRRAIEATLPFGRYGAPSEIAATVAWLLSDEASYVNGAPISVDGGVLAGNTIRRSEPKAER